MVLDPLRTVPLKKSIHRVVKKGDVVCDIGSGLGLLAYFAISAGAKFVYAIDCDGESLGFAAEHARKQGLADRISFIEGHSSDVFLPEKVDAIICETIGSAAFDENILATLADAKKRFLKPGGKIIPSIIELWGAPAMFPKPNNKSALIDTAVVSAKKLLGDPKRLVQMVTRTKCGTKIHVRERFVIKRDGRLSGIAIWPKIEWAKGSATDASPLRRTTHWKQCTLPAQASRVRKGDTIKFELIIGPDSANPREQTEVLWKLRIL
jgi:protein arginine N-methyltransferase 1